MGERSLDEGAVPTDDELERDDRRSLDEALTAGALGFSSSRTLRHRVPDGRYVPGTFAAADELLAFAEVLARHGRGVIEVAPRFDGDGPAEPRVDAELSWMEAVSHARRAPAHVQPLAHVGPGRALAARDRLACAPPTRAARSSARRRRRGSSACSPGLAHRTPFDRHPAWQALGAPVARRAGCGAARSDAAGRADRAGGRTIATASTSSTCSTARTGSPATTAARRTRCSRSPTRAASARSRRSSTWRSRPTGGILLSWPLLNQSVDAIGAMLAEPEILMGLADAGAHVGQTMDASAPTYLLTYWVRERGALSARGRRPPAHVRHRGDVRHPRPRRACATERSPTST